MTVLVTFRSSKLYKTCNKMREFFTLCYKSETQTCNSSSQSPSSSIFDFYFLIDKLLGLPFISDSGPTRNVFNKEKGLFFVTLARCCRCIKENYVSLIIFFYTKKIKRSCTAHSYSFETGLNERCRNV